jgi:hypothetical protein
MNVSRSLIGSALAIRLGVSAPLELKGNREII